jgi:hypothetical protein
MSPPPSATYDRHQFGQLRRRCNSTARRIFTESRPNLPEAGCGNAGNYTSVNSRNLSRHNRKQIPDGPAGNRFFVANLNAKGPLDRFDDFYAVEVKEHNLRHRS